MTSPVLDDQRNLRPVEDLVHPTNDERFGIVGDRKEDAQFAVSKSDLMQLLRGETLIRGPLRRTLNLSDGPFVIVEDEDEEPIERVKAPEPVEFTLPEPEPVEEPDLRERIGATLRNFVDGVMDFIRRDPEVQRHGKHVGQEGREGAKGGSQPGFTHEDGIKESFVAKIGEALQKNARHVITLDVLDQVREGRGWLSPDGILTTNFGPHDNSAAEALDEFGIEYSGNPQSELLALGFARLILSNKDIAFGGLKNLTYPQARFMAFLLDKDSTRPVFVDYYDNDGQYTESADKGKGRDALGKLVDQGYRLVGRTWVPNSGVARHGEEHIDQEGREGERGGSQPGYTHDGGGGAGSGKTQDGKFGDKIGFRQSKRSHEFERAIELLDSVLDTGQGELDVKLSWSKDMRGTGGFIPEDGKIKINPDGNWTQMTILHELGHKIDHELLIENLGVEGEGLKWASVQEVEATNGYWDAVLNSRAYKEINTFSDENPDDYWDYLLDSRELWARSFEQYIMHRTSDPRLIEDYKAEREQTYGSWERDDFEPIAEAMDSIFESAGMLHDN